MSYNKNGFWQVQWVWRDVGGCVLCWPCLMCVYIRVCPVLSPKSLLHHCPQPEKTFQIAFLFSVCLSVRRPLLRLLCPVWPPDTERYDHTHTHKHTTHPLYGGCSGTAFLPKLKHSAVFMFNPILAEVYVWDWECILRARVCIFRAVCVVCVFVSIKLSKCQL